MSSQEEISEQPIISSKKYCFLIKDIYNKNTVDFEDLDFFRERNIMVNGWFLEGVEELFFERLARSE